MHIIKEIGKVKSSIFRITDCHSSSTIKWHIRDFHRVRYVHSLMQPSIILWVTHTIFITFGSYLVILWEKSIFPVLFLHEEDEICQNNHGGFWKRKWEILLCKFFFIREYLTPWFYHNTSNCENNKIANVEFLS